MNGASKQLGTPPRRGASVTGPRRVRYKAALAVIVATALLASCHEPPAPPAVPAIANATDPQWVTQSTPHARVAVVFVHGIFGDTLGTWTNASGETFFRLLKAQPTVGAQVDVFAFGFTSNMFKQGSFDIREAANKLHDSLQYKGVLDYPTIVFVAHSMGGLVVLRDLLTRREMLDKVPLLVFYATPQEGAQIAAIAEHVARNPALAQMVPADGNAFLQQLNDDWKSLPVRPHVSCAYEKLPTDGVPIVPWTSATRFCDGAASAIDADHSGIVKPDRLEHPSVVVLVNALNQYVVGKNLTAKLETPDFVPEGDHLVFHLSDPSMRGTARLVNTGGSKLTFTLAQVSDPHLYLSPDDTPREIAARQTQPMHALLTFGAKAAEYRFVLQSDVAPDQVVAVRVDNIAELGKKQAALLQSVSSDIDARLADRATVSRLASLPPGESKAAAEAEVVGAVHNAIARENPDLPESAQWVLAASLLEASNWPQLAATALRRAERLSPATARSSSARWLAGAIAAQSGDTRVFAGVETPKVNLTDVPRTDVVAQLVEQGQADALRQLALRLQQIPSLKPYGLSLEGDLWAAKGDKQAARNAYSSAATLDRSPSLSRRMSDLESLRPRAPLERERTPSPSPKADVPFRSEMLRDRAANSTDATRPDKR